MAVGESISAGMTLVSQTLSHFECLLFLGVFVLLPSAPTPRSLPGSCGTPRAEATQTLSLARSPPPFLSPALFVRLSARASGFPPSIPHPLLPHHTPNVDKFWGNFKSGRTIREMDYLKQAALDLNTLLLGLNICVSLPRAVRNCPNYNQEHCSWD